MHAAFMFVARAMALLGGIMLSALIILTCASVLGRELNGVAHWMVSSGVLPGLGRGMLDMGIAPINGDFELIEAGVAFSIFAFIPLCQITSGHATVEIFTDMLSPRVNRFLSAVIELVFAAVLVLIAVQIFAGMQSKIRSGQTTLLLQFPVWWAYALSVSGAVIAAIIGVYMAIQRLREAITGQSILPASAGADH